MRTKLLKGFGILSLLALLIGCEITVNNPPVSEPEPDEEPTVEANITIETPSENETVSNPIHLTGEARVFESQLSWRLKDVNGNILMEGHVMSQAADSGQFGDYEVWIPVPAVTDPHLTVEAFQYSAMDGSVIDLVSVPVLLDRIEKTDVQLYFHNDTLDPEISCTEVFPVPRSMAVSESAVRVAMLALLQGPSESEKESGYSTTIPFMTELKDINLKSDGTLIVDLKGSISYTPMAGSCLVGSIRAEIEQTAMQFATVKSVEILIDGEENRLEP
ncbi:MAG: Gmad2 immunoglobulin-like domain-containing protein [Patescibacteria group bacterium]